MVGETDPGGYWRTYRRDVHRCRHRLVGTNAPSAVHWALALIVATPALAAARGAYSSRSHLDYVELLFLLLGQLTLAGLFVSAAWAITASDTFASEPLIVTWATSAALLAGVRIALHTREVRSSHRYSSLHPTLIVGAGRVGKSVARRLLTYPEFGLLPIGYLDDDPLIPRGSDIPVLGNIADLDRVVEHTASRKSSSPSRSPRMSSF